MSTLDVTFESDIPKIVREGTKRTSKYDVLLDKVSERAQDPDVPDSKKVAVLTFDTQGEATSRYTSLKGAASKRDDADNWTIAVRSKDEGFGLYIKWSEVTDDEEEAEEEEPKPAPKKQAAKKKAAPKKAKVVNPPKNDSSDDLDF